jgi:endonuclease/exonuclease/phosphatase (EEP) superfamily protein YafD
VASNQNHISSFIKNISITSIALIILSVFSMGGPWLWPLSLLEHFRHIYFLMAVGLIILLLLAVFLKFLNRKKFFLLLIISTIVILINIPFLLFPVLPDNPTDRKIKVFIHNVSRDNSLGISYGQRITRQFGPDIIVLFEFSEYLLPQLKKDFDSYPYWRAFPADNNYGLAVFSKLPFNTFSLLETEEIPFAIALSIEGHRENFYFVHLPPPITPDLWDIQKKSIKILDHQIHQKKSLVVVAGDFNLTPWSSLFRRFQQNLALNHGNKLQDFLNWPHPFPFLSLDQILTSANLKVQRSENLGSDHFAYILEL